MIRALDYLGTLPDDTVVYNGHEYTAGNLAFARSIDGNNRALDRLTDLVNHNPITTGLTTVGDEKEWNVFMRLESEPVRLASKFVHHWHRHPYSCSLQQSYVCVFRDARK